MTPEGAPESRAAETAFRTPDAAMPVASPVPPAKASEPGDLIEDEFRSVVQAGTFYAAMLAPLLIATGWSYHTQSRAVEIDFWTGGALYTVITVWAVLWRRDWLPLVRWPEGGRRRWLVVMGLTPLVSISVAELLQATALGLGLPVQDLSEGFGPSGYPVWLLAMSVVLFAPVFEELAFRGLLLVRMQRVMSGAQAIWVTAILFGVLHLSALSLAVLLVPLGAIAGYLTRESKSLLPALVIHAAHNAGVLWLNS